MSTLQDLELRNKITRKINIPEQQKLKGQEANHFVLETPAPLKIVSCDVSLEEEDDKQQNNVQGGKQWEEKEFDNNNSFTDSSEEYDTDLDAEDTHQLKAKESGGKMTDVVCRDVYHHWCENFPGRVKPFPQRHISENLSATSLCLRNRSLGSEPMFPLSAALVNNIRVQKLNLDGADIQDEGVIRLVKALEDNITVSHLNLSNNNLEYSGIQWIGYLLIKNKFINYLNLSGNKIKDISAADIGAALEVNKSLDRLDLSHNELEEKGMKLIAAALVNNSKLKFLNLSWNHIRGQGAVAISQCLKFNESLQMLDVSWNGFGYEGSLALSKSLKENDTLQELNLSNNRINWRGALLLSRGIKVNTGLRVLRLGRNPLTTTGSHDIVTAIAEGSSQIRTLDLEGVPIVADTEILSSFIRMKRHFRLLHGGIVNIPDKLGERKERKKDHMEVVMEYIKEKMARPLEMLKNFDKSANIVISQDEFVARLVKAGVPLHKFEMRILAKAVAEKGRESKAGTIDYKMLVQTIMEQILQNRARHYREEAQKRKLKEYHKRILDVDLLKENAALSRSVFSGPETTPSPVMRAEMSSHSLAPNRFTPESLHTSPGFVFRREPVSRKPLSHKSEGAMVSMSTPLEEIGVKNKKKKKSSKGAKKKKRSVLSAVKTCVSELQAEQ